MTLPVAIALNLTFGASFVAVGRPSLERSGPVRSPVVWMLLLFELLVVVPCGAFLLLRYPDWSWMYLVDEGQLPWPSWAFAAVYPLAALLGLAAAATASNRNGAVGATSVTVLTAVLALGVAGFGQRQLVAVGTTSVFLRSPEEMALLWRTPLLFYLVAVGVALLGGWAVALWRLLIFCRLLPANDDAVGAPAARLAEVELVPTLVPDRDAAQPRKPAKKVAKKKPPAEKKPAPRRAGTRAKTPRPK